MADGRVEFIECTSLNFSYNTMGIVTVSYTVVHNYPALVAYDRITAGGQVFEGYILNVSSNNIPKTEGWYESHVTLLATTN